MRQNMERMRHQNCHLRQSISNWLASFYNSNGFLSVDRNSGIWYWLVLPEACVNKSWMLILAFLLGLHRTLVRASPNLHLSALPPWTVAHIKAQFSAWRTICLESSWETFAASLWMVALGGVVAASVKLSIPQSIESGFRKFPSGDSDWVGRDLASFWHACSM